MTIARRTLLAAALGAASAIAAGTRDSTAAGDAHFAEWVERFRARARARGISDATYTAVMGSVTPDTTVYAEQRNQPEFHEPTWKYLNRRVSAWRVMFGKQKATAHAALFDRIEAEYGVDRYIMLGVWGMESAFGEVITDRRYMRPVIPALAALAYGEPRRRAYWEQELLNALVIIDRHWSTPAEMIGSWAGAMGHTQWMPEVWLGVGEDFNHDGRISPFGAPDDSLAGTARYLRDRGHYHRGEIWGVEVELPPDRPDVAGQSEYRLVEQWRKSGLKAAGERKLPPDAVKARLWVPVTKGPAFLVAQNFFAVRSYDPSSNYALAVCHLGDRIRGEPELTRSFPNSERTPTLAEMQELQRRLTKLGYDTGYTDGRTSRETIAAVADMQRKFGVEPHDGYPGLDILNRLRQDPRTE